MGVTGLRMKALAHEASIAIENHGAHQGLGLV